MRSKYDRYEAFCALIDQANGLPAGTTKPADYDKEKLKGIIRRYARTVTVLQWGLAGAVGALCCEDEALNSVTKTRREMPFYNFDWGRIYEWSKTVDEMGVLECEVDLAIQPEAALKIFGFRRKVILTPEKKRTLWEFARTGTWHSLFVDRIIKNYYEMWKHSAERADEVFQALIDSARMVSLHGERPDPDSQLAKAAISGEGDSQPADSDQ